VVLEELLRLSVGAEVRAVAIAEGAGGLGHHSAEEKGDRQGDDETAAN
jgi:hypothetical protein